MPQVPGVHDVLRGPPPGVRILLGQLRNRLAVCDGVRRKSGAAMLLQLRFGGKLPRKRTIFRVSRVSNTKLKVSVVGADGPKLAESMGFDITAVSIFVSRGPVVGTRAVCVLCSILW